MGDDDQGIELKELLAALRRDLQSSAEASENEVLRFEVQDIEVDLEIEARRTGAGGATKVSFFLSAEGKPAARTQRVKLKLKPVSQEGRIHVSDSVDVKPG